MPNANRTLARKVRVTAEEDFSETPDRRYINFTGFPFPIGPLLYRKTTCREVWSPGPARLLQPVCHAVLHTIFWGPTCEAAADLHTPLRLYSC